MFALGVPTPSAKRKTSKKSKPKYPKGYVPPKQMTLNKFLINRPIEPWKSFNHPKWCILPAHLFTYPCLRYEFEFGTGGFVEQYTKCQMRPCPFRPVSQGTPFETLWTSMRKEMLEKYCLNQKVRFAFKRLVNIFLERKLRNRNEVDPATFEKPIQAVRVVEWKTRSIYTFEAKSLALDMRTRLLQHEELFPMPSVPRNPFTNAVLTFGQLCSIYDSLKAYGKTDWLLEAYRDARFDLYLFSRDNTRKLRLFALRDLLQTSECKFILLDFIQAQHSALEKHYDSIVYEWAVTHSKPTKRIESWKEYCYKFYEIDITVEDVEERIRRQAILIRHIEPLCTPCEELKMIRQMLRTKRRQA